MRISTGFVIRLFVMASVIGAGALVPSHAWAGTTSYMFDDGTAQGWTSIDLENPSTGGPWVWIVSSDAWYSGPPQPSGDYYACPGTRNCDGAHSTRIFRSPEFTFVTTGGIAASLYLRGGIGGVARLAGDVSALQTESSESGFLGVALRDAAMGTYVTSVRRTAAANDWALLTFDLSSVDRSHTYTLDLVDAAEGVWGWAAMDSVTVLGTSPEPAKGALSINAMLFPVGLRTAEAGIRIRNRSVQGWSAHHLGRLTPPVVIQF